MLYKCDECGHDIAESARYCPNCGAENPWRDLRKSPYFVRRNGRLVDVGTIDQPCHRCGKILKPRKGRVFEKDPEEVSRHGKTSFASAQESIENEPLFYYWCSNCYEEAKIENERSENELPAGCLIALIGIVIGLIILCLCIFF